MPGSSVTALVNAAICGMGVAVIPCFLGEPEPRRRCLTPWILHARVCSADGRVRTGVTIVQRIVAGPLAIEAAVRVLDVFGASAANTGRGFSYVTLARPAERGLATFKVDVDHAGALSFKIETWSRPAGVAGAVMGPTVAPVAEAIHGRSSSAFPRHRDRPWVSRGRAFKPAVCPSRSLLNASIVGRTRTWEGREREAA